VPGRADPLPAGTDAGVPVEPDAVAPGGAGRPPLTPALAVPDGLTGRPERADGDSDLVDGDGDSDPLDGDEPPGTAGRAEADRAEPGVPVPLPSRLEAQRDTNS
jgi:hypothetical protein